MKPIFQWSRLTKLTPLLQRAALALLLAPALSPAQSPAFTITTIAGNNSSGFSGDAGPATSAQLSGPYGLAFDSSGTLYIADQLNHRIRSVSADGTINTIAGSGTAGFVGDGGKATSAGLNSPLGVAVDSSGNVFIADTVNDLIRKVSGGNLSTVVGSYGLGFGFSGDGGAATNAQLDHPAAVVFDSAGNMYVSDSNNHRVRKITTGGTITTFAGAGPPGFSGDGGAAINADLNSPRGLAVDAAGNLYIADSENNRVRKVATDGTITTIAGNGTPGFSGDGGPAANAQLNRPRGVAVDAAGNVYIADYFNSRIRRVAGGIISTVAGNGYFDYGGDAGPAISAALRFPAGVAVDRRGYVYVADTQNNVIRLLTPRSGGLPSIKQNGVVSASEFGALPSAAPGSWIEISGADLAGGTRLWNGSDFHGVNAPTSLDGTTVSIGGQAAYVDYISPTQVNAQVPSTVGPGPQPVTVSSAAGISAAATITVNPAQPGLYAPQAFSIGGKQYAGAVFSDGATFVLPTGAVSGISSRPARPGDTITFYGVGFGPVTPDTAAGQIVLRSNTLASPFQIFIGSAQATVAYQGLAPNAVGLYQFNVVVPNIAANDAVPVTFTLAGAGGSQTLYIAVRN